MEKFRRFIILLKGVFLMCSFEFGLSQLNTLKFDLEEHGSSIYTPDTTERIIGGRPTPEYKYPYMACLHKNFTGLGFKYTCGGVVLHREWILTAAHCIDSVNEPNKYILYIGLHKLSRLDAPAVQKIKVAKIFRHKDFNNVTFENDIALIKAAELIDTTMINEKGLILPRANEDPTGLATVIGWGDQFNDGGYSDILMETDVPIIGRKYCNKFYDRDLEDGVDWILKTTICAGKKKKDACLGDSGGPLIQTRFDGISILIGIVSYGMGCGEYPGVYTQVSAYKEWMYKIMFNRVKYA